MSVKSLRNPPHSLMLTSDCIADILYQLKNDRATLYSCLLTNRLFCRLVVPLLWSRPFEHIISGKKAATSIIHSYLSCLTLDERQMLSKKLKHWFPPLPTPLFDYPKYLRAFDSRNFRQTVQKWWSVPFDNVQSLKRVIDGIELFSNVLLNHIHSLELLKLEQEYNNYFDEEGNLICSFPEFSSYVRAGQVLHNLRKFELTYWIEIASNNVTEEKILGLLNKVIESSTIIRQISINMPSLLETQQIVPLLSKLISRQHNLETFEFDGRWDSIISNTLCLSIHSHLKYLRINNITTIIELLPILNSWTHLDTLVLCRPQVIDDFTKINVDTLPPIFIRKLLIYDVGPDRKILDNFVGLLLRLANRHLKVFSLQECITPKLCKILVEYCRNLTHLSTIINTIDLSSLCTTLRYLPSIEHLIIVQSNSNSPRQRSWMISNSCGVNRHSWETKSLKCLANSFPPCLKYLGMCINFSVTQLKILLQNIEAPICIMEFCNVGGDMMMDKTLELHFLRLMAEYAARNPGFCVLGLPESPEAWYDADFWKMAKDSIPVIKKSELLYYPVFNGMINPGHH
ncbi:1485_t:CDS:2 [Cetraspora pellucida]|uniref:1485_t:CDS:1 n=1 Tax=Cetraspora pellucida TaxID=1433469 RepID=A0ACA9L3I5_9GLOM|nr:1485_t:CDS:2 [Cetraspora pellucida]